MKKAFVVGMILVGLLGLACSSRKHLKTIKLVTCAVDGETVTLEDGNAIYITVSEGDDSVKTIIMSSAICSGDDGMTSLKIFEDGKVIIADTLEFDKLLQDALEGIEITEEAGKKIIVLNQFGDTETPIKIIKVTVDEESSKIELEIAGKKYVLPDDLEELKKLDETEKEPEEIVPPLE
ncbi:hypothetical protein JXM67_03860 [candidate division WOR-3 bacterium]|nr:hypothetical protein [candidate division WOR-3 bacterium]